VKYEIVSHQKARGRNGTVFLRVSLARHDGNAGEKQAPATQQDAVISITDADENSPLWEKDVGEIVEIG
jgi:hypothetical protein